MDTDFDKAKELVEETIRKLGLDPAATRAPCPNDNQAAWTLKRGSASVLVTVTHHEIEEITYLRVVSPVVTLPTDSSDQVALLRRLLELNTAGLANAAFGLMGDRVVVVSERPTGGSTRLRSNKSSSTSRRSPTLSTIASRKSSGRQRPERSYGISPPFRGGPDRAPTSEWSTILRRVASGRSWGRFGRACRRCERRRGARRRSDERQLGAGLRRSLADRRDDLDAPPVHDDARPGCVRPPGRVAGRPARARAELAPAPPLRRGLRDQRE